MSDKEDAIRLLQHVRDAIAEGWEWYICLALRDAGWRLARTALADRAVLHVGQALGSNMTFAQAVRALNPGRPFSDEEMRQLKVEWLTCWIEAHK